MDTDVIRKQQGLDYNHSVDNEYQRLRSKANMAMNRRKEMADESQLAYQAGQKDKAHEFSVKSKEYQAEADDWNRQAAEYVFRENNADSHSNEIDLHGLWAKEALWILKRRLAYAASHGETSLHVITGKGVHSVNHVAKIKEATMQLFDAHKLDYYIPSNNKGVIIVTIERNKIPQSWEFDEYSSLEQAHIKSQQDNYYHSTAEPQYHKPHQNQSTHQNQSHHQQQQSETPKKPFGVLFVVVKSICICLTSE
ncbi:Uncharacterized protein RNJ44_04726 [Nakaseomyces bracarensis]|uniref:Smr domain-containing protein n=1 Tax=Nakaseomyces bracarensis TaxID=273131 RepID=A0ABR4NVP9_9SACH